MEKKFRGEAAEEFFFAKLHVDGVNGCKMHLSDGLDDISIDFCDT